MHRLVLPLYVILKFDTALWSKRDSDETPGTDGRLMSIILPTRRVRCKFTELEQELV